MSVHSLVLASQSPQRVALLAQIGIVPKSVVSPNIDEAPRKEEKPRALAARLARAKLAASATGENFLLAADTVVAAGRRILPKAEDRATARTALALLSGRRHRVITSVVLRAPDGQSAERICETIVQFAHLHPSEIENYLDSEDWRGKAGGYAIQGRAAVFVRFISGSYSNVVGLPLYETALLLRGFGWNFR